MNLLAIDTSTEACSAALLRSDGARFGRFEIAPRQHNRLLPQMIDALLDEAALVRGRIDYCAFANGPGAFTGIRIAAAQAQGIGLGLGIPLIPVSTLALLAQTCFDRADAGRVLVALDARMNEVYWAVYRRNDAGLAELVGAEHIGGVDTVEIPAGVDAGAGHGWLQALRERVDFPVALDLLPDASSMLALARQRIDTGDCLSADRIEINYLRNQVADKPAGA